MKKVELAGKEVPITSVTVFSDRAEIRRHFPVSLDEGLNEVVVKGLHETVDEDSIRVEGVGEAKICEVQYQKRREEVNQVKTPADDGRKTELKRQLDSLLDKQKTLKTDLELIFSHRNIIVGLSQQLSNGSANNGHGAARTVLPEPVLGIDSLEALDEFLAVYTTRMRALNTEAAEKEKEAEGLGKEIEALGQNLVEAAGETTHFTNISREVSILVEGVKAGEVKLTLSYIVSRASWTPSYDLRVYTDGAKPKLSVQYYGLVKQKTGEDWKDASICLSTAQPSVGGTIPSLKTLHVAFKPPLPPSQTDSWLSLGETDSYEIRTDTPKPKQNKKKTKDRHCSRKAFRSSGGGVKMEVAQAQVKESVLSASFQIERLTTIPSDNTAHKVNVGLAELEPKMEYWTVPAKSAAAYLKARVVNTSTFPLLPGPASVFLDNNFVAKTKIRAVSPNESFTVSLGIDYSIRVEYKPLIKRLQEVGVISKSSVETRTQKIKVKNTRKESVSLTLLDHLPLSGDEKIKVTLVAPAVTKEETEKEKVSVNKDNNVEWVIVIEAGKEGSSRSSTTSNALSSTLTPSFTPNTSLLVSSLLPFLFSYFCSFSIEVPLLFLISRFIFVSFGFRLCGVKCIWIVYSESSR